MLSRIILRTAAFAQCIVLPVPGVVAYGSRVAGHQVVRAVVDALVAVDRAIRATLGRVVVDDIEHHLDAGPVQRLDHRAKRLVTGGGIRRLVRAVRREEAQRHVAPVLGRLGSF